MERIGKSEKRESGNNAATDGTRAVGPDNGEQKEINIPANISRRTNIFW
jgi:hypothetical protein